MIPGRYHQLIQMYEAQLVHLAFLYQTALNYLKRALMYGTGFMDAADKSETIISLFSEAVIMDYQMNPENCFEQFKKIEESFDWKKREIAGSPLGA